MAARFNCGNEKEHMFHGFKADIQYHCSGKAECETQDHEPHFFTKKDVPVWCRGVCKCGLPGYEVDHGPGEHK